MNITPTITTTSYIVTTSYNVSNDTITTLRPQPPQVQTSIIDVFGLVPVVISCIFYVIIAVFAIFGNALVVGSFIRHRHLRTFTNYFVVSLAVADMLVGMTSIPMWMSTLLGDANGEIYAKVYTLLDIFSGTTSIIHLMVISLERFYAIMFPVRHRNTSAAVYYLGLVFVWVWPAIMSAVSVHILKDFDKEMNILVLFLAFFVLPLIVILFAYGGIWRTVRTRIQPQATQTGKRSLKRDMRVIVTIALVILFFVISWLPFFVVSLMFVFCLGCISLSEQPSLILFVKFMHYSNSAVNPIVYAVKIPEFRRAFRQLVGLCLCRARNLRPRDHELFSGTEIRDKHTAASNS